jgi:tetratricopeptide (TPR) repeat protein
VNEPSLQGEGFFSRYSFFESFLQRQQRDMKVLLQKVYYIVIASSSGKVMSLHTTIFTSLVFLCSLKGMYSQTASELKTARHDSTRLRVSLSLASKYVNNNLDSTFYFCDQATKYAKELNSNKGIADAQFERAYAVYYSGKPDSALKMYNGLLKDYRALKDSSRVAACYNKMGFIHREKGDLAEAILHYNQSLRSNKDEADKSEAGNSYLNIGVIYHDQENYKDALKYELLGLSMYEAVGDNKRTANALARIGNVYLDMDQDTSALNYYQRSLALSQQTNNNRLVAICLNNMAMIYSDRGDLARAAAMYQQALKIREEIGDKNGVSILLNNIGEIYGQRKMLDSARYYVNRSLEISISLDFKDMMATNYLSLAGISAVEGDYKTAYSYYVKYHATYAEVNSDESRKRVDELNASLENERNQRKIDQLSAENTIREAALQQERIKGWLLATGLIAVLIFAFLIWMNMRRTRKVNAVLEEQKAEIAEQKKIVEEQHNDIVDSINYALRIQHAVMPSRDYLKDLFPDSFLFNKPRDIVSGDFWWITRKNHLKVLVVADCTGHGVPGAFMSLIGTSLLNEIINEKGITQADEILNLLSAKVVKALHQNEERESTSDGMDIALAIIDEDNEMLHFAGANNSLYYSTTDKQILELKGDRQPIGYYIDRHKMFTVQQVSLKDVTNIWLCTDGYADQFCGIAGPNYSKKFKYSRLRILFSEIQHLTGAQQRDRLAKEFEHWKENMFQVDDILIAGIRLY